MHKNRRSKQERIKEKLNTHFDAVTIGALEEVAVFALATVEAHGTAGSALIFDPCDESCTANSRIGGVLAILIFSNSLVGTVQAMRVHVLVGAVNTLFSLSPSPINKLLPAYNIVQKQTQLDYS